VQTMRIGRDDDHAEGAWSTSRVGADEGDNVIGDAGIRTPGLGTIDDPLITDLLGMSAHTALNIRPSAGFG
jgi:hypothetical protein